MCQDPGLQGRAAESTGMTTKASALGLGVTSTTAAAQASATPALNATVLNCEIIVRYPSINTYIILLKGEALVVTTSI